MIACAVPWPLASTASTVPNPGEDGGVEVTIFSGPDARDRAFQSTCDFATS
jgi:hypothetical protein